MLKLTHVAAVLLLAGAPAAFAATPAEPDASFKLANVAPPEEPEPPATPPAETTPADPNGPAVNDPPPSETAPAAPENPVEGAPPEVAPPTPDPAQSPPAPEVTPEADLAPEPAAGSGLNTGYILAIVIAIGGGLGAYYWFINRNKT